ncbi:hypothetical protein BJX66DRAFT_332795 [Aspergillus keveii]|uniref:Uncharacterized protein n=1 Tax=Aspergillus keveii TaxID=714993 RepID=A0ABR4GL03_9EURO
MTPEMSLPLHDPASDTPRESDVFIHKGVGKVYAWLMTESEKQHIATMLDVPDDDRPAQTHSKTAASAPPAESTLAWATWSTMRCTWASIRGTSSGRL